MKVSIAVLLVSAVWAQRRQPPSCSNGILNDVTVDFETDASGNAFSAGDTISSLPGGITKVIAKRRPRPTSSENDAIIFDSSDPSDDDFERVRYEGKVLAISAHSNTTKKSLNRQGGVLRIVFGRRAAYQVKSLKFLNLLPRRLSNVEFRFKGGAKKRQIIHGHVGSKRSYLSEYKSDWYDVRSLRINFNGTGALAKIELKTCTRKCDVFQILLNTSSNDVSLAACPQGTILSHDQRYCHPPCNGALQNVLVDFEQDGDGNPLQAGLSPKSLPGGIDDIFGKRRPQSLSQGNDVMLLDTSSPLTEPDLRSSKERLVLIISKDGNRKIPNDNSKGGFVQFNFKHRISSVNSVYLLDAEQPGGSIRVKTRGGAITKAIANGKNGEVTVTTLENAIDARNVRINLAGSGAVAALNLTVCTREYLSCYFDSDQN